MKTGDTMRFWEVLAQAEDDTTVVVEGLDNHLHISNPNQLGCGYNAVVKVFYVDTTEDGRPTVWVHVVEDTTTAEDEDVIAAYLDANNLWWGWEQKPQEEEDTIAMWALRKEKQHEVD